MNISRLFHRKTPRPILRIDDRLIHSQVVVGWGEKLKLYRIILSNDRVFKDEMLTELYTSLIPPEIDGLVLKLSDTNSYILSNPVPGREMVLVENPGDALVLLESGFQASRIVIGGLHFIEGSKRLLSYVFIDENRRKDLKRLLDTGVPLVCQDLPTNPLYKISEKLLEV